VLRPTDAVRSLRGHEALAALAEFLENLKPDLYRHISWSNNQFQRWLRTHEEDPHCGTTACAGGWATSLFDGLILLDGIPVRAECEDSDDAESFGELAEFFEINGDDADRIFNWDDYEDPNERSAVATAARIRAVLARAAR
jgi:hypothetical protein